MRQRIDVETSTQPDTRVASGVVGIDKAYTTAQSVVLDVSVIFAHEHVTVLITSRLIHATNLFRKRSSVRSRRSTRIIRKTMERHINNT